jgi:hypothetical protein
MQKIVLSLSRRVVLLCLALAVFSLHSTTVLAIDATTEMPPAGELSTGVATVTVETGEVEMSFGGG